MNRYPYVCPDTGNEVEVDWEIGDYLDSDAGEKYYIASGEGTDGKWYSGSARFFRDELIDIQDIEEDEEMAKTMRSYTLKKEIKQFFKTYYASME